MKEDTKILAIAILSPVIAIILIAALIGFEFLAIAPVAYAVMFIVNFLLLSALNMLFHKVRFGLLKRLVIAGIVGILGGAAVYLGLFFRNISEGSFSNELFIQYSLIGCTLAFISFLLYSIGPTQVELE